MPKPFTPMRTAQGTVLQSSIPSRPVPDPTQPFGLLVRGVVTQTYVLDSPDRLGAGDSSYYPTAVYCDVFVYSSINGMRWSEFKQVPVFQERGGLHGGRIWKPRPTTMDITGVTLDLQKGSNPGNYDGDHVLIGFLENALNLPIILGGVPHPAVDQGNANFEVGKRFRLQEADGDPDFQKHHGSYYGIDGDGNWVADTSFAHDGQLNSNGTEPDPPVDGKGAHLRKGPKDAVVEDQLLDMGNPLAPVLHAARKLEQNLYEVLLDGGKAAVNVQGGDSAAVTLLGDGAVKAAIADHLQTFWGTLKTAFDTWGTTHVHATAWGPSGPPNPTHTLPAWDTSINSTKLKFPDG